MTAVTQVPEGYPERVSLPRQPPRPLDPPMVPFALAGTGLWVGVGLVALAVDAPRGWVWTALAGFVLGLALLGLMAVRDRRRRHGQTDGTEGATQA